MTTPTKDRVLSGMRPTGALHLGHYHGAIKNWVKLQYQHECYFFVADWHALTTHYESRDVMAKHTFEMVIDWLACGLDPEACTLFIQSRIPEHAELFTLLAMGTPLGWLERVPTYKDQQEKLRDKDLATYGFLGYPLLQAADILIYKPQYVPVGEDQSSHVELTREVARRFNHLYGREANFEALLASTLEKLGKESAKRLEKSRKAFQEAGDQKALEGALGFISQAPMLDHHERERLTGWFKGTGKTILPEPQVLLTDASKLPGLDGQKMSKSYGNAIAIREDAVSIEQKVRTMPTDPARVKLTDKGDPAKCPVWQFHLVYSDKPTQDWAAHGCKNAEFGCLTCKRPVIDAILKEQQPMLERAAPYVANPKRVIEIVAAGTERARTAARATMTDVRAAMGLNY
jgi:tryptophanyl-tRNA synthetase